MVDPGYTSADPTCTCVKLLINLQSGPLAELPFHQYVAFSTSSLMNVQLFRNASIHSNSLSTVATCPLQETRSERHRRQNTAGYGHEKTADL
jgi:hypothetical protein